MPGVYHDFFRITGKQDTDIQHSGHRVSIHVVEEVDEEQDSQGSPSFIG